MAAETVAVTQKLKLHCKWWWSMVVVHMWLCT